METRKTIIIILLVISNALTGYFLYCVNDTVHVQAADLTEYRAAEREKKAEKQRDAKRDRLFYSGKDADTLDVLRRMKETTDSDDMASLADEYAHMVEPYNHHLFGVEAHQYVPPARYCNRWFTVRTSVISIDQLGHHGAFSSSDLDKAQPSEVLEHRIMLITFNDVNGGKSLMPVDISCRRDYIPQIK